MFKFESVIEENSQPEMVIIGEPLEYNNLSQDEKLYTDSVYGPVAANLVTAILKNIHTRGTQTKRLVSYTKGDKASSDDILTDHKYNGDMNLEQRCNMLKRFNDTLATLAYNNYIKSGGIYLSPESYQKVLDPVNKTCKIYRIDK